MNSEARVCAAMKRRGLKRGLPAPLGSQRNKVLYEIAEETKVSWNYVLQIARRAPAPRKEPLS